MTIRTRFAPSPTGYLHIGGARTALFSWAYARRHGGKFILRIEDTDLERSTQQSVDAILEGMRWLGLDWDEGPLFQMKRLQRYEEVADQLVVRGHAYPCWATREELEKLRAEQRSRNEKPRYDGRWRPERGLKPPKDGKPVIRFRTPEEGSIGWDDLVKGRIDFPNAELDDLVLLRADGVPTYNFGVVVDDLDMGITHVIRGDDHVNNTPRQLHILNAINESMPFFAHVPMILGADGERLSKRHGAVSLMQYRDQGFLPEALVNYLARLGWSHGDEELFSKQQFVEWFDLAHVSHAPARFDTEKLLWLNAHYMRTIDLATLQTTSTRFFEMKNYGETPPRGKVISLLRDRANTAQALVDNASYFYGDVKMPTGQGTPVVDDSVKVALVELKDRLSRLAGTEWSRAGISEAVKAAAAQHKLKMPQLAMPLRLVVTGQAQTPPIDAVLELLGRETVLQRLAHYLQND